MRHKNAHFTVKLGVWLLLFISIVGFELIESYVSIQNQKWRGAQLIVQTPMLWDESTMGRVPSQISSSFSVYTNIAIEHQGQWQGVDIQALTNYIFWEILRSQRAKLFLNGKTTGLFPGLWMV